MAAKHHNFFPVFSQLSEVNPQKPEVPSTLERWERVRNDARYQEELERRCGVVDVVREYEAERREDEGDGQ